MMVVPPGNARSLAASPSSLPEAAAIPPFGAPAPSPALEAELGLGWRGEQSPPQAFGLLGALW